MSNFENENVNLIDETPVIGSLVESPVEGPVVTPAEEPSVEKPQEDNSVIDAKIMGDPTPVQALGNVNGAIGATTAILEPSKPSVKKEKKAEKKETVAIHSTKNVTWPGVGKVYVGYNIVGKAESEKWLTRSHIRTATPEEIAKEFGK